MTCVTSIPPFTGRQGQLALVFLTMRWAFEEASAATGVSVGMMVGIDRSRSTEETEEAARFAAAHAKDGVVSLGLAGAGRDGHEEHALFGPLGRGSHPRGPLQHRGLRSAARVKAASPAGR